MSFFHVLLKIRDHSGAVKIIVEHPAPTLDDLLREIECGKSDWLRGVEHREIRSRGERRWATNETAISIAEIGRVNAICSPFEKSDAAPLEVVADDEQRAAA